MKFTHDIPPAQGVSKPGQKRTATAFVDADGFSSDLIVASEEDRRSGRHQRFSVVGGWALSLTLPSESVEKVH